ncbi:DsbA family protein [Paenirhodobacter populi]|uniref:DsbA family protein n=1 Tax=Paenirhodobacter populi TaxID=2306993 RepID=A0A443JR00_9RHOB|nr:DsbA family protein [Sinirhodobacter populi]RWR22933.1 DsbA family protein [Sinirhodobacter populi]
MTSILNDRPKGAAHRQSDWLKGPLVAVAVVATGAGSALAEPGYTDEFAQSARAWLLDNPEVVLEVFTLLEQQEAVKKADAQTGMISAHADALFGSDDGRKGNPLGQIVVVEFFDYQCGYCRAALAELTSALEGESEVAVVLKEFPILGPASEQAARLALAVRAEHGDEAYISFHNTLLAQKGQLNDTLLRMLAGAAGFDFDALSERGRQPDISGRIAENKRLAQALSINGTPAFVFRDGIVPGLMTADRLRDAFQRPGVRGI